MAENIKWTEGQKQVITTENSNILVSASAGSGKTAVLIERIMRKICNRDNPSDLNRLLVVTFTRAAANSMREKLRKSLMEKQKEKGFERIATSAVQKLQNANIMTIDSFCSDIVRDYFYLVDLDAQFRIADEGELDLIDAEAAEILVEKGIESGDPLFLDLVEYFSPGIFTDKFKEAVISISKYCDSEAWPLEFLDDAAAVYSAKTAEEFYESPFIKKLAEDKNIKKETAEETFKFTETVLPMQDTALCLIKSVKDFMEIRDNIKKSKNIISFADLEHYALQILIKRENRQSFRTDVAESFMKGFDEILVDEYQDTNIVQEEIIKAIAGENNLFTVGDVKQSIYAFRQARPELFIERSKKYAQKPEEGRLIYLAENFRSEKKILDIINGIFVHIMDESTGNIDYDEKAMLVAGKAEKAEGPVCEGILALKDVSYNSSNMEKTVAAARTVARKIVHLVENEKVRDEKTGKLRDIKFSDIVILMRATASKAKVYIEELARYNIPAYNPSKTGYFDSLEVNCLLDYLSVIDNIRQDIPLASAMLSFIGGFTDEELVKIRLSAENESEDFHESVLNYSSRKTSIYYDEKINEKLNRFFADREKYMDYSRYLPVSELLELILEETGFEAYISSMNSANIRLGNVEMLKKMSREFSKTSYKGLYSFLRYMDMLQKYRVDFGEVSQSNEEDNLVRITTIHSSKGLEYPVVFVTELGSPFNMRDDYIKIHQDYGMALPMVDIKERLAYDTPYVNILSEDKKRLSKGEELRLLYVAFTRARERLFMVFEGANSKLVKTLSEASTVDELKPIGGSNAAAYILPTFAITFKEFFKEVKDIIEENAPKRYLCHEGGSMKMTFVDEDYLTDMTHCCPEPVTVKEEKGTDEKFNEIVERRLGFSYSYEDKSLPIKLSVSDIKRNTDLDDEKINEVYKFPNAYIPEFAKDDEGMDEILETSSRGQFALKRGIAYHSIMERLDFTVDKYSFEMLNELFMKLEAENKIEKDILFEKDINKILKFTQSQLYVKMNRAAKCGRLFREKNFSYFMEAEKIYNIHSDEKILVEGVIDAYFIDEDNCINIVDYKTDSSLDENYYRDKYRVQLKLYSEAMERALKLPVSKKLIYSIKLEKHIEMD